MRGRREAVSRSWRVGAALVAGLQLLAASPGAAKDKKHVIERFRANAMDIDTARATIVEIGEAHHQESSSCREGEER